MRHTGYNPCERGLLLLFKFYCSMLKFQVKYIPITMIFLYLRTDREYQANVTIPFRYHYTHNWKESCTSWQHLFLMWPFSLSIEVMIQIYCRIYAVHLESNSSNLYKNLLIPQPLSNSFLFLKRGCWKAATKQCCYFVSAHYPQNGQNPALHINIVFWCSLFSLSKDVMIKEK